MWVVTLLDYTTAVDWWVTGRPSSVQAASVRRLVFGSTELVGSTVVVAGTEFPMPDCFANEAVEAEPVVGGGPEAVEAGPVGGVAPEAVESDPVVGGGPEAVESDLDLPTSVGVEAEVG